MTDIAQTVRDALARNPAFDSSTQAFKDEMNKLIDEASAAQKKRNLLYDERCLDLARYFLADEPTLQGGEEALADAMQTFIEGWIEIESDRVAQKAER